MHLYGDGQAGGVYFVGISYCYVFVFEGIVGKRVRQYEVAIGSSYVALVRAFPPKLTTMAMTALRLLFIGCMELCRAGLGRKAVRLHGCAFEFTGVINCRSS